MLEQIASLCSHGDPRAFRLRFQSHFSERSLPAFPLEFPVPGKPFQIGHGRQKNADPHDPITKRYIPNTEQRLKHVGVA